mmetsp:Transcript_10500/g.9269  ORF Transcript_10500/g.9269 Transcript_10500/m.9269 type:complete len:238 (+) Transcript_10500:209-922(+)
MDKQMLFDLMVLLEERNLTLINQNQEAEATLDDTKHKLQREIEKQEAEVEKYRGNMEFLDNQTKAENVRGVQLPPVAVIPSKDTKGTSKDNLTGIDKVEVIVNDVFDSIVPKHIASKEIGIIGKLQQVEATTQDLLDMRSNIIKYGDLNLLKEVKDTENYLDRNRKNMKLQKNREEEKEEKIKKQLKSQQRAEKSKDSGFKGRKPQYRATKPKLNNGKKGKVTYNEHEADIMRYVYN